MSDKRINCCCGNGLVCPTHGAPPKAESELAAPSGSASLRRPTYAELYNFALSVWRTCGQAEREGFNAQHFNQEGNKLFLHAATPRKCA